MGGYGVYAEFYDRLTTDVAYGPWADYLLSLFEKHGRGRPETLLDLACGSGRLSLELASRGVTVNAVAPGFIETDMTAAMPQAAKDAMMPTIPMQRLGAPEDVAKAVAFLASDEAAYVTGQVLAVDGGMAM